MMSSPVETSVYVIRDFPMERSPPDPTDNWIRIRWTAGKLDWRHPPSPLPDADMEGSKSSYVGDLQKFREKRGGRVFLFLTEARHRNSGAGCGYDIFIHHRVVRLLCLVLPQPFLLIRLKVSASGPSGDEDRTSYEKRLELTDLLKEVIPDSAGGFFERRRLFPFQGVSAVPLCDVILGWKEQPTQPVIKLNAASFGENLFGRESSKDVAIICGNGAEIRCHKLILEAHSDVLAAMLSPENGMKESELGRIEMTENSEQGITHLVRYLYGMELKVKDIPCDIAVELFKTGDKYKLEQLVEALIRLLLNKGKGWYTPDELVELYFHVTNLDQLKSLQEHLISIMLSMNKRIRVCERFREIERTDAKAATELLWKLFDNLIKKLPSGSEPMEMEDE